MIIDGKKIANNLLIDIKSQRKKWKRKIPPTLSIIVVGKNAASDSYIRQKKKTAKSIGIDVNVHTFKTNVTYQELAEFIRVQGTDPDVHGIIIQRPLPSTLSAVSLVKRIPYEKDVDSFRAKTPHTPPLGEAMLHLLASAYWGNGTRYIKRTQEETENLVSLLKTKSILLIGCGATGGKPIAKTLKSLKIRFLIATSATPLKNFAPESDIIISAVGKSKIITPSLVKSGAILISVGIWKDKKNKMRGDYEIDDIKKHASLATPTPGGVGPVNVACLLQNVVNAAFMQRRGSKK